MTIKPSRRDYSLIGRDAAAAVENGLAAAEWYKCDIPRKRMKELMQRRNGPAIRDTIIWFGLLLGFGAGVVWTWGTWWVVPFLICYGAVYGGSSDSRWHECGHGTAFRTRWLNDALYQIASFMVFREPTIWRWSHTRHHTDTIIVGRDPEIAAMRPPAIVGILSNLFAVKSTLITARRVLLHATGRLHPEEATFIPEMERPRVFLVARIWLLVMAATIAAALALGSWLPIVLLGPAPTMYGGWLVVFFGLTQHAGLAEDVLDHRLNSRTVYMNPVFRYLYWNMNYHIEHHMFPMVPYHALPTLHDALRSDMPRPYSGTIEAYREIIPAMLKQLRDPTFFVERQLPPSARAYRPDLHGAPIGVAAE
jgi:fatty acid desaturase